METKTMPTGKIYKSSSSSSTSQSLHSVANSRRNNQWSALYFLPSDQSPSQLDDLLTGAIAQGFSCNVILYSNKSEAAERAAASVYHKMKALHVDIEAFHLPLMVSHPSRAIWEYIRNGDCFGQKVCIIAEHGTGDMAKLMKSALFADVRRSIYTAGSTLFAGLQHVSAVALTEFSLYETHVKLPTTHNEETMYVVRPTRFFSPSCVVRRITCVLFPCGELSTEDEGLLTVESEAHVLELLEYGRKKHVLFGEFAGPTILLVSDDPAATVTASTLREKGKYYMDPVYIKMHNPFAIHNELRKQPGGREIILIGNPAQLEIAASFLSSNPELKSGDHEVYASSAKRVTMKIKHDTLYEIQHYQVVHEREIGHAVDDDDDDEDDDDDDRNNSHGKRGDRSGRHKHGDDPLFPAITVSPKLLRQLTLAVGNAEPTQRRPRMLSGYNFKTEAELVKRNSLIDSHPHPRPGSSSSLSSSSTTNSNTKTSHKALHIATHHDKKTKET